MTAYRIVQLSDLHLTERDADARSEPRLYGRLRGMNQRFRSLLRHPRLRSADLVLVTGDVTDRGSFAAWQRFRALLDEARLLRRCLVLPGNHDVCDLGVRPYAPRRALIHEDLERVAAGLALCGQPTRLPWARRVDERVVVFGLDSSNPGNLSAVSNAVGALGWPQLERLGRMLARHREVPVKLVALHHSPNIPSRRTAERRGVKPLSALERWGHEVPADQRRALRLLCLSHRVRLVLHGHLHRAEDRRVNGLRIIGAPASTEPLDAAGRRVRVWSIGVHGRSGRVLPRLETLDLDT